MSRWPPVGELLAFETEDVWAREIASRLVDLDGVVNRESLRHSIVAVPAPETAARLAFYGYVEDWGDASVRLAVERLDAVLATAAPSAPLLVMRGALHNAAATRLSGESDG